METALLEPGVVIDGKYRVLRPLGEGAMGAVFEGQNVRLNRRVAIKVLHASIASERSLVTRFEREAQAAANIGSMHVVNVFDLGDLPNGDRYMVMELLEGENLQTRLVRQRRILPEPLSQIALQILEGLDEVHRSNIVHRDLKPANIFLARVGDREIVKILDFGVCKMRLPNRSGENTTAVGAVLGTLGYMSPEQLEHGSKDIDGRADIYALGVILYRASTGRLPYGGSTMRDLLRELREGRAPQIADLTSDVDKGFAAIVHRALEWDRTARYATAKEMQNAFLAWRHDRTRINAALNDFLQPEEPPRSSSKTIGRIRDTVRMDDAPTVPPPKNGD